MTKVNICGIKVDNITMSEAVDAIRSKYGTGERFIVVTPNSEIIEDCSKIPELAEAVKAADMTVPDGIGVIYASRILKQPLKEKVGGCDLAHNLIEDMLKCGVPLFILGGKPGVAEQAAANMIAKFPELVIAGVHDGYFKDNDGVVDEINSCNADVLFVCMGSPHQELWMYKNRDKLKVSVMLGLGGTVDVFAGTVKRPPPLFINLGLEWLYRIVSLRRFKRIFKLFRFISLVFKTKRQRGGTVNG